MTLALRSEVRKKRVFHALGVFLLLMAPVFLLLGSHNFVIRSAGLGACLGGLGLLRVSKTNRQAQWASPPSALPPPTRTMWLVGSALAVIQVATFYFLYLDSLGGSKDAWPIYAFAATAMISAPVWAAILARSQG